jgi:hypothetical protein
MLRGSQVRASVLGVRRPQSAAFQVAIHVVAALVQVVRSALNVVAHVVALALVALAQVVLSALSVVAHVVAHAQQAKPLHGAIRPCLVIAYDVVCLRCLTSHKSHEPVVTHTLNLNKLQHICSGPLSLSPYHR